MNGENKVYFIIDCQNRLNRQFKDPYGGFSRSYVWELMTGEVWVDGGGPVINCKRYHSKNRVSITKYTQEDADECEECEEVG
jgi:hypothetical protein